MDKYEAIQKLEELSELMSNFHTADEFLEGGGIRLVAAQGQKICERAYAISAIPDVFHCFPTVPKLTTEHYAKSEQAVKKFGKRLRYCLIAAGACLALGVLTQKFMFYSLLSPCLMVAAVFFFLKHSAEKQYDREKKAYDTQYAVYENGMTVFRSALAVYEEQRAAGIAALQEHAALYPTFQAELKEIADEYAADKKLFTEARDDFARQIATYDFVPEQYYHLVDPILALLKSGRADDYKEALNMAIREEQEEQERQERRAAEARQAALEERRAEEERRHNERMEAQQRAHNAQMEKQAAQAEHDRQVAAKQAERDARNAAFQQKADLKKAATHRCNSCANNGRCNIRYSDAAINCAAFRPR